MPNFWWSTGADFTYESPEAAAFRAIKTQADPFDSSLWGLLNGKIVRMRQIGEYEEVPIEDIRQALHNKIYENPEKSLTDRAFELMFHWIACQTRPSTLREDDEELPREAVRFCRALESEVAKPTERPEKKPRAARRAHDEDDEVYR